MMGNTDQSSQSNVSDNTSEGAIDGVRFTRRAVLATGAAGLAINIGGAPASAQNSTIGLSGVDGYGGSTDGVPEKIEIDEGSKIVIRTPSEYPSGQLFMVELQARPASSTSEDDFEEIGTAAFQETGQNKYIINGSQFPDEGRDLLNHSQLDADMFKLEFDSLSDLKTDADRIESTGIDIKVGFYPRGGETIATAEDTLTVRYTVTGGLGVNLGYSLGRVNPISEDSPHHDGFDEALSGSN